METDKKIDRLSTLSESVKRVIRHHRDNDFPVELLFNDGMEKPQFRVVIEKMDTGVFVDSTGKKWVRVD